MQEWSPESTISSESLCGATLHCTKEPIVNIAGVPYCDYHFRLWGERLRKKNGEKNLALLAHGHQARRCPSCQDTMEQPVPGMYRCMMPLCSKIGKYEIDISSKCVHCGCLDIIHYSREKDENNEVKCNIRFEVEFWCTKCGKPLRRYGPCYSCNNENCTRFHEDVQV